MSRFGTFKWVLVKRFRLPEDISFDLGALLEPLAVAIHASRRAQVQKGCSTLVLGAGTVGLLCAAVAKACGSDSVIIADIQKDRLEFAVKNDFAHESFVVPQKRGVFTADKLEIAKELAARFIKSDARKGGEVGEFDAVFECTGAEACTQAAIYVSKYLRWQQCLTDIIRRLVREAKLS